MCTVDALWLRCRLLIRADWTEDYVETEKLQCPLQPCKEFAA